MAARGKFVSLLFGHRQQSAFWFIVGLLFSLLIFANPSQGVAETLDDAKSRLAQVERKFGNSHLNTAMALQTVAEQYIAVKNWPKALSALEEALTIRQKAHGSDHPMVSEIRSILANLELRLGKLDKAVALLQLNLAASDKMFGSQHLKTANAQVELARLYRYMPAKQEAALALANTALPVLEAALWQGHPNIGDTLNIIAAANLALHNLPEAQSSWLRVLEIRKNSLGSDHLLVAITMRDLGRVFLGLGELQRSEVFLRDSLKILRFAVGEKDPKYAASLEPLLELLVYQQRYEEAQPLLEKVLTIYESSLGSEHPRLVKFINDLGLIFLHEKAYAKAQAQFQRSLKIANKTHGENHLQTAFILVNLSDINRLQGEMRLSQRQFSNSINIAESFFKGDDLGLANWLSSIATTLHKSGNQTRASQLFKQSLSLIEAEFGIDHPHVKQVRQSLLALQIPVAKQQPTPQDHKESEHVDKQSTENHEIAGLVMVQRSAEGGSPVEVLNKINKLIAAWSVVLPVTEVNVAKVATTANAAAPIVASAKATALFDTVPEPVKYKAFMVDEGRVPATIVAAEPLPEDVDKVAVVRADNTKSYRPISESEQSKTAIHAADAEMEVNKLLVSAFRYLPDNERVDLLVLNTDHDTMAADSPEQKTIKPATIDAVQRGGQQQAITKKPPINKIPPLPLGRISLKIALQQQKLMISIGCFLPKSMQPKYISEQMEQQGLPVFNKAKVVDRKIYSCLFLGPYSSMQSNVDTIAADITKHFGLKNLAIVEYQR